uniref:Monocyte to macrophage differentiation-associated 2b n=1 Tax=Haplochromis burtoni TaxID=8153 RepID=A0A3Q3C8X2_HAPBU
SFVALYSTAQYMNNRVPPNKRYQPTEYEHAANCATHALWIIPSLLGSSVLHFQSEDQWERLSAWVYGAGLSSLFIISTLFHTVAWKKSHLRSVEQCFHMCDRMVIYFFIAASYAPWLNLRELGPWACHMRWLVWVMASFGTTYSCWCFLSRPTGLIILSHPYSSFHIGYCVCGAFCAVISRYDANNAFIFSISLVIKKLFSCIFMSFFIFYYTKNILQNELQMYLNYIIATSLSFDLVSYHFNSIKTSFSRRLK